MILENRVAIVTGAGSGIGQAGALIMAGEGAFVVVVDLNAANAAETVGRIEAAGGRAECLVLDVTDDTALEAAIAAVAERHGRIDILHNHAGAQVAGDLEQVAVEGFDRSWSLNVRAHFMASRFVMPLMKKAGRGVILNTSSSSGVLYDREMIAYTTTKHAVIAMTRQMAGDYARFGIRVNALCPGWVDTPFNEPFIAQMGGRGAIEAYVAEKVPLGRWADVSEIAEPILFLVSDRSSYMTGQILVVDGGETIV
ncbi:MULTISPECIES: SDR family NAD(P)-dependent oxidoreductase [Rhizobium]|uniref:SDR family oxidoreductase n=1 Tax=Rhizobium bangladeshense TaxID=1138189 RepID=A0ABS7LGA7_9HYPH|nr:MULTISPECIES: SDR family oxidoreductase [Rhizobium]MBX4868370.1 SDR family oxidoreductase [Rhizobium bangladeshense]MBX4875694.1 SDR family oxidoreductase [Rhizobium bangladeshense]MBX4886464.1 SDR family oxidoreductase [Rhizobium bangladeshense]MBX4903288.1 SDR family oxidoreductase [Rhizobium bangladeshense]MBX4915020.1 SDR family oxidoreductase [Rhizobium bangladeshense]